MNQTFWGSWSIFNPVTKCAENYQFNQPETFIYTAQQKQLAGEFTIVRYNDAKTLDVLILDIKQDHGLAGCEADMRNYQGKKSNFSLKLLSPTSAEICTDDVGQKCTDLYLNKR